MAIQGITPHSGSWFGLPDFGITESIGRILGAPKTAQGGSNIFGNSQVPSSSAQQAPSTTSTNTGSVLGTSTQAPTSPVNTQPTADIGGGSSGPSYEDQMRSQIDSGYNNYFAELDKQLAGLSTQRGAQENIANTSYNTNLTDLGLQRDSNLQGLNQQRDIVNTNQVKTLKDVSSNIRNLMNAGNTYLGSMGAGDSSAVNQYAYGLTKLGSQQRGDVMSQSQSQLNEVAGREANLNNIFMQEKNRLAGERDTKIQEIATWFADAQNKLSTAKANGQLAKSQDLQSLTTNMYNAALQQLNNIQNMYAQRSSALENWAMSNATNLNQLKQNMAQIAQFKAQPLSVGSISGTPQFAPQGAQGVQFGGSGFMGLTDDQKRLLGLA